MTKQKKWTREQTIVAFNVYCKIPFKKSSKSHPTVIKYANIIGRSPSALNMKIGNFGRLDPALKKQEITGLVNGSKLEEEIWNEFNNNWEKLAFESEVLITQFQNNKLDDTEFENINIPEGKEHDSIVKSRVNQSFFRSTILSSYNLRCCITGLAIPELLIASHIKPWAKDKENRTNPHNGLCLNAIHDKAFDRGLITVTPDFKVKVSNSITARPEEDAVKSFFMKYNGQSIIKPERFLPAREFLDYHYNEIFIM